MLYRKDLALDGRLRCLLYGYGAYGIAIPASFNANRLSLVDRGFVYAIAHIRGGKDKGFALVSRRQAREEDEHLHDFIAAAEYLIDRKASPRQSASSPWRQRRRHADGRRRQHAPEKFGRHRRRGAVRRCAQHHARRHAAADAAGMAGMGQPDRERRTSRRILSYSPYDNVAAKAYPPILAMGGLTDPRVTYWEPAKWVAKLRAKDDRLGTRSC
jgi:oligopeptidase B